jgi:CheY-like chemotaxis protein
MDGQEAYNEIVKRGGPDAFDVILMDLHMPRKVRIRARNHSNLACEVVNIYAKDIMKPSLCRHPLYTSCRCSLAG